MLNSYKSEAEKSPVDKPRSESSVTRKQHNFIGVKCKSEEASLLGRPVVFIKSCRTKTVPSMRYCVDPDSRIKCTV